MCSGPVGSGDDEQARCPCVAGEAIATVDVSVPPCGADRLVPVGRVR